MAARPAVVAIPPSLISTAGARGERRRCDAWDSALSCSFFQFPSSFLPWRLRWRTLRGGETAGLAISGVLELGPWRRQPDLAASTSG